MDKHNEEHIYVAIDLKSFYASVECRERGKDALTTNLVVADPTRTEKTICLAVSPALKAYGIPGRARLFEVVQRVKEVNKLRLSKLMASGHAAGTVERSRQIEGEQSDRKQSAGEQQKRLQAEGNPDGRKKYVTEIDMAENDITESTMTGFDYASYNANLLDAHPEYELTYIVAPPRMALYMDYSTRIYNIYLKYIAPEDISVYSIDEVFMDVTHYLRTYHMTARELASKMIDDVLKDTGITATCGIGTNLYLCKIAMDIMAKHAMPDERGVRIAELNENSYKRKLWDHRPITDFWRVGAGYAKKLEAAGMYTMGDVARCSTGGSNDFYNEEKLYKMFGINAELLIDHAWGYEPVTIADIKAYRPQTNSISSGQVLQEPYDYEKTKLIVREMTDLLVLDLVDKRLVTDQIVLTIGYDIANLSNKADSCLGNNYDHAVNNKGRDSIGGKKGTHRDYTGEITIDRYGRKVPKHAHGTANLGRYTSSTRIIMDAVMELYDRIIDPSLLTRRITVVANRVCDESKVQESEQFEQLDLFTDYQERAKEKLKEDEALSKERKLQEAMISVKKKYGKNAMLKGMNLEEGATTISRNNQIGGHKA